MHNPPFARNDSRIDKRIEDSIGHEGIPAKQVGTDILQKYRFDGRRISTVDPCFTNTEQTGVRFNSYQQNMLCLPYRSRISRRILRLVTE